MKVATQSIHEVYEHQKFEFALHLATQNADCQSTIIFIRSRDQLHSLTTELKLAGLKAESISGNKKPELRERAITDLKNGNIHFLVATEAVLRDTDLSGTERIIQYDFHELDQDYLKRSESCSLGITTLVTQNDAKLLARLEELIGNQLEKKYLSNFNYDDQPQYIKPLRAKGCGPNKTGSKPLQHKKPKLKNKGPRRKTGRTRKR